MEEYAEIDLIKTRRLQIEVSEEEVKCPPGNWSRISIEVTLSLAELGQRADLRPEGISSRQRTRAAHRHAGEFDTVLSFRSRRLVIYRLPSPNNVVAFFKYYTQHVL